MTDAALYFTEWTAPDGTKRRPLLERCSDWYPFDLLNYYVDGDDQWFTVLLAPPAANGSHSKRVDPRIAAALCRCTVEDWLIDRGFIDCILKRHPEASVDRTKGLWDMSMMITRPRLNKIEVMQQETIHHALIAAAHAVLDSQGVPR